MGPGSLSPPLPGPICLALKTGARTGLAPLFEPRGVQSPKRQAELAVRGPSLPAVAAQVPLLSPGPGLQFQTRQLPGM